MTATYAAHIGRQRRPKKPVFTVFVSVLKTKKLRRQSVGRKYGYGVKSGAHTPKNTMNKGFSTAL